MCSIANKRVSIIIPIASFQTKQGAKLSEHTRCLCKWHTGKNRGPVILHRLNLPQVLVFTVIALKKTVQMSTLGATLHLRCLLHCVALRGMNDCGVDHDKMKNKMGKNGLNFQR